MRAAMADIPGIGNGAIVTVSATGRVGQVVRRRLGQTSPHDVGTYRVLKTPLMRDERGDARIGCARAALNYAGYGRAIMKTHGPG